MTIVSGSAQLAQEQENPITKRAAARSARQNQQAYALATFIFGCLCQEEVLHFDPNNSDDMSDMQIGINLIAACIRNYIDTEAPSGLPFDWHVQR